MPATQARAHVEGYTEMAFLPPFVKLAFTCKSVWLPIASLCKQVHISNLHRLATLLVQLKQVYPYACVN